MHKKYHILIVHQKTTITLHNLLTRWKLFSNDITLLPLCNKVGLLLGDLALVIHKLNWNMQQQIQGRPAERQ